MKAHTYDPARPPSRCPFRYSAANYSACVWRYHSIDIDTTMSVSACVLSCALIQNICSSSSTLFTSPLSVGNEQLAWSKFYSFDSAVQYDIMVRSRAFATKSFDTWAVAEEVLRRAALPNATLRGATSRLLPLVLREPLHLKTSEEKTSKTRFFP